MKRNKHTEEGSTVLWQYGLEHFVTPHVKQGNIQNDMENNLQR